MPPRAPLILLCGLVAALIARPQGGQAAQQRQEQETPQSIRAQTLGEIEQLKSRFPLRDAADLSEVLAARLMQGFVLIELKEEPQEWPFVVPIKGNPHAVARITISRKPREASDAESPPRQRFTLILDVAGEEGSQVAVSKLHVFAGPLFGQLNMSMDRVQMDGTHTSVQVIQLLAGADNQPPVALHLSRNRAGAQEADLHAVIPADSFIELARIEPELFEEFVRPMLSELGLAALFEYTVRDLALQAFLRDLPVASDTAAKVQDLLKQLDDADFARREAAQAELAGLGRPAATALARLRDDRELSPEQMTRVRAILVKYEKAQPEQIEGRMTDREFLESVAALRGEPDDDALADLARQRLGNLKEPATSPAAPAGGS